MGATVGTAVGLGTAGLIFNNKTNSQINEINSSLKEKILELAENGLTKTDVDSLQNKGDILYYGSTGDEVINKYKKNPYNYINKGENWGGDNFRFAKDEHLLYDIKEA